jgi:hypothetical protein
MTSRLERWGGQSLRNAANGEIYQIMGQILALKPPFGVGIRYAFMMATKQTTAYAYQEHPDSVDQRGGSSLARNIQFPPSGLVW